MAEQVVADAAQALQDLILRQHISREHFSVGMGADRLHAYIRCPKNRWRGPKPDTQNDIPVEWHWNVGPVIAA